MLINSPAVFLSFDDTYIRNWADALPVFDKYQARATFFVSHFNALSDEEVVLLQKIRYHGHAIGCHSLRHLPAAEFLRARTPADYMDEEVAPAVSAMLRHGFCPSCFSFPCSQAPAAVQPPLLEAFHSLRTGAAAFSPKVDCRIVVPLSELPRTRFFTAANIDSCSLDASSFPDMERLLGRLARDGECASFYAHDIADSSHAPCIGRAALDAFLSRGAAEGISFRTYDDLLPPGEDGHREPGWVSHRIANWTRLRLSPASPPAYSEVARLAVRSYIRELWAKWGAPPLRVALYGAGAHTRWLEATVAGIPGPQVLFLLDDRGAAAPATFRGLAAIPPRELPAGAVDAVVVSSDTANRQMARRMTALLEPGVPVIDPYQDWPQGPYPK